MFQQELEDLANELGMSDGELLKLAREVTGHGTLRPIDRLSNQERKLLLAELQSLAEPLPA